MNSKSRYHSSDAHGDVVSFSVSMEKENLLARGLGPEHLREMLLRIARPLLRRSAHLAYGGNWKGDPRSGENFTYELLKLISDEQLDNSAGGPDTNLRIGKLYNHSAWPHYLEVTPRLEAQWINCCRIVRITQQLAGIAEADVVRDRDQRDPDRVLFNQAVTLSAMRRIMMTGIHLDHADVPPLEEIPPVTARIMLGGKITDFSGFAPGLFEEALVTLEHKRPLFIIGGFGGTAEVLAKAMLNANGARIPELTLDWHTARTDNVQKLMDLSTRYALPPGTRTTAVILDDLQGFVEKAQNDLPGILHTGLTDTVTRELMTTRDMNKVVQLVRQGLAKQTGSSALPA